MISRVSRQLDVQLGPGDVLGAALLCPGFCEDLSTWRLTIDESGLLTQQVFLYCDPLYLSETLTRTSQLTPEQLQHLLQLAEEIGFAGLKEEYDLEIDDAETTTIVVKTESGSKRVYSSGAFCAEGRDEDAEMQRYVRLWEAIVEHAPTSSAAWRQDRADAERRMHIAALKVRVKEKDFMLPTLDNLVGAALCPLALVLIFQLVTFELWDGTHDFPDVPQIILWSCIMYAVMMLVFVHHVYARRRDRLAAEQQLAQFESESSEFVDLQPNTEY